MGLDIPVFPVYGERALSLGKTLVVADLHIGIEHELRKGGVAVPSQTKNTEERLVSLVENTDAEELVVLGDVKHNIPSISLQEYRELPGFIKTLSTYVDVTVVKGNHDGNLGKLVPQVDILDFLERGSVLFLHGHSWIKAKAINADIMVMAHCHPAIAFVDEFSRSVKEPAWIKARFNEGIREHYEVREMPEVVVMPAFNHLISGVAFNHRLKNQPIGPYFKSGVVDVGKAHTYLLDGTDLGALSELETAQEEAQ